MSVSRPTITEILEEAFLQQPGLYEQCRSNTLKCIEAGDFVNFFTDYPSLICTKDLNALHDRYIHILRSINASSSPYYLPNELVQKINFFVFDIGTLGASELLNKDGNINQSLIDLLNLPNGTKTLKGHERQILKSYVGMVVGDVNDSAELCMDPYKEARNIMLNRISRCANEMIKFATGFRENRGILLSRDFSTLDTLMNYPKEHPAETAMIAVAGVLAVAGLFGGGAAIAKVVANSAPVLPKP